VSMASPSPVTASRPNRAAPVLEVRDLRTYLYTRWGVTKAVDGVSFSVDAGETLGIVGESGCGKSMLALSLVRLTPKPASRTVGGQVLLDGEDLLKKSEREMRDIRGRKISMILQDPHQSLNPVYSVGNQVNEALVAHREPASRARSLRQRAVDVLRMVRIPAPERRLENYPHELSGGMKQRVVGAMAIAFRPRVLIADEPTTALDVTIQAQYLRLLKQLQAETGVGLIFITHDFGVVAAMCDRVAVMYAGRIVEEGSVRSIFDRPSHPYTRALLNALPKMEQKVEKLASIEGSPPALFDLPPGCAFAPRCQHAHQVHSEEFPPYFEADDDPGHRAACWLLETDPSQMQGLQWSRVSAAEDTR
jgi:oligopeptide/dipeptide ABC transporter ATP-binding protein